MKEDTEEEKQSMLRCMKVWNAFNLLSREERQKVLGWVIGDEEKIAIYVGTKEEINKLKGAPK